jgi:hypothetical protein
MKNKQHLKTFFWGLGMFIFSASTVALVTDPYLMADIALLIISIILMVSGLTDHKVENV